MVNTDTVPAALVSLDRMLRSACRLERPDWLAAPDDAARLRVVVDQVAGLTDLSGIEGQQLRPLPDIIDLLHGQELPHQRELRGQRDPGA